MKILMVGPDPVVKGGISSIIRALQASSLKEMHQVRHLSSYMDYTGRLAKARKLLKGLGAYFAFIGILVMDRPDAVHIHTSFGASFYRKSIFFLLARLFGVTTINHIHGAEFDAFYTRASRNKQKMVSFIYRLAGATIVLSDSWKADIQRIVGEKPVHVLNNFTVPDPMQTDYARRGNLVLYMGEVGRRKGAYDLPDIIAPVVASIPDVRFVICGNGDVNQVTALLKAKGLTTHARLTGWIDGTEKKNLLNEGRIFLLPTYHEGQPMAILEAMGYAMPIVSTTVGGIPELVHEGENGYLSEPGDTVGMSENLIRLLKNPELAADISANNLRLIAAHYTLDAYLEQLDKIYETLFEKASA